jgi:hypothetical protein
MIGDRKEKTLNTPTASKNDGIVYETLTSYSAFRRITDIHSPKPKNCQRNNGRSKDKI